jgi:hypothetical protein
MRKLCFCSATGLDVVRSETFQDDALVPTNVGTKRADQLQGSTKARLVVPGLVNAQGSVTYTAKQGGAIGNKVFIEQTTGQVGSSFPGRTLAASVDLADEDGFRVVVTFGTTGSGASIRPTAQQVANLVNAAPVIRDLVVATAGGSGDVGLISPTYLTGGADDGDWRKFNVKRGDCLRINTVEVM